MKEAKEMVKTLHDNDISVVMDVVYNHVYNAGEFCFNVIVPEYFSRVMIMGLILMVPAVEMTQHPSVPW